MAAIIIEGIDGAGKSTLVERIKKSVPPHFDVVLTHKSQPKHKEADREYCYQLSWLRNNHFFIADRYHVGEMIYGPIYRSNSIVDEDAFDRIEQSLDKLNAVKVVLLPSKKTVKQRLKERGEDFLKPEYVDEVYNFYKDFLANNPGWIKLEDNSKEIADSLVETAIRKG